VDEVLWQRGYRFLTVVYQIDAGVRRLLWIGKDRKEATLERFFREFGKDCPARLRFIRSDMRKPCLLVIASKAAQAVHVLDRVHVASNMSKAFDEVRAAEARELKQRGYEPVLKHTRFCLLKRPDNLAEKQEVTLAALLRFNLRTVRAYLLKEDFQWFWSYVRGVHRRLLQPRAQALRAWIRQPDQLRVSLEPLSSGLIKRRRCPLF
jgi:transposase